MGEKFAANPVTGTGSMTVPIAVSPGRSGFGPQLALSYDSGGGNGPFGFGWNLSLPAITRKTDKGLPQYRDSEDSDVFILSGAEDLVPVFRMDANGDWTRDDHGNMVIHEDTRAIAAATYQVRRYRPRVEGLFARIERWANPANPAEIFWRSISKDNITTWYGKTEQSRIVDPADPTRIFSWLICESYDDKGNVILYRYQSEDGENVDLSQAHERNRGLKTDSLRSANRYLKSVFYGNRKPYLPKLLAGEEWPAPPDTDKDDYADHWMFEVVFDYEEGHYTPQQRDTDGHEIVDATTTRSKKWIVRNDPFSSYRAGFEVRTYRLCQRALMFHHFPGEAEVGANCLVRSTDFNYSYEQSSADPRNPIFSFLCSVTQSGYKRRGGAYLRRSLPPLEFEYTAANIDETVHEIDPESLENLPYGIDGGNYQWIDLDGEGLSGILTEQADSWFYKRNLGPIHLMKENGIERAQAKFAPVELVGAKPNAAIAGGQAQFMDLAGDGQPDLVLLDAPTPGFYEHDEGAGWNTLRAFSARLNRNTRDPNLKFIDLDGDGHADVLITEDEAFTWHPSLGEEGFGPAERVSKPWDEEKGPAIVFADATQSIYLADLSGDGLTDLVRVRNGAVCYWPNLGYGRFGDKVTMDNAPLFDHPDQFDQKRIRLADIDGSGVTDIIYLRDDGVRLYFNQSGNSWSDAQRLEVFPRTDNISTVTVVDLLGNGTACLVWSSPLPGDARRQMRYVDLMGGQKPHLLVKTRNNLGAETQVRYAPSTRFYLRDKLDGKPWITRLPFPVHVVERVETYDHISRNLFVTRFAYHHGYFDGEEREFRGFGMVEQWDTEQIAALTAGGAYPRGDNIADASHAPPAHTKTWFHTGVYLGREQVSRQFEHEYFREPGLTVETARPLLLDDTDLPVGLTSAEEREACRALKGSMLRKEIYAEDAGPGAAADQIQRARTPYTVTEQNFSVRALQPRGGNRHAVFFTHAREAINYHYERNPADPRVQHALTLEVDANGNVLKQAAVGYGRRTTIRVVDEQGQAQQIANNGLAGLQAADQAKQTTALLTYTENRVTNAVESADARRNPLPCEALTFELTGYAPTGPAGRYQASDMVEPDHNLPDRLRHKFAAEVAYEATASGDQRRRPIEWLRTLYRHDELSGLAPLGELHLLGLPGESYKLAFTPGLLTQVFQRPHQGQPTEPLLPDPAAVLGGQAGDRGGYLPSQSLKADGLFPTSDADDHWWIPSGRSFFTTNPADSTATELTEARGHFFLARRYRDPFGQDSFVDFDTNDLLMVETSDALSNRVTVNANDYRVLQPRLVSDPNRNRTEVVFDTLGMVVGTVVMGKPLPAPVEGDTVSGFVADPPPVQLDAFFGAADPHAGATALLKDATTRIVYDLDAFSRSRQANPDDPTQWRPVCAATLARETHAGVPLPPQGLKIQISVSYSDGFGREIQKKIQAEPGPVVEGGPVVSPRWVGSGWTIFNNKGKPVRQYEPFFSVTHGFEFGVTVGVSPVIFYDPVDRVIATLRPNHTFEKVVFDPWQQTTYDVNDTCAPRNAQTGDPRADPDIQGYVARYFASLPVSPPAPEWQTWRAQRIDGALGPHEQAAATRAAAHADTPTTAHFDALGRPFLTVARNRVVCAGHDLDGTEDQFSTRVELDIEGNQRAVSDERKLPVNSLPAGALEQRIVMRYAYDMLGNRIHQLSMEAGARWMLNDAAGKPIRAWDSRGHNFTTAYDALRRPVYQTVRGTTTDSDPRTRTANHDILVDKIEYGEPPLNASPAEELQAQRLNLRARIYRHFDSAGVATNARLDANDNPLAAYDFKGNLLHSTRRLVSDYAAIPDWLLNPQLDDERFESSTRYDALNRPVQSIAPHSSLARAERNVIQPVFNEANLLERVDVWLEWVDPGPNHLPEPDGLLDPDQQPPAPVGVANIDYDAKGRRLLIDYKNGASTVYDYDPLTFRLSRLRTRRNAVAFPGDDPQPPIDGWPGRQLQNLRYTYDPAGNITHLQDDAQQAIYFKNQRVEPSNDYTYDALYRLIQATGREHLGQGAAPAPHSYNDAGRVGILSANPAGRFAPNDASAMGAYTERYVYDGVGNFLQMKHERSDAAAPGWSRRYVYAEASLIEPGKQSNRLSSATVGNASQEVYGHDVHGNMLRMPQLQEMQWDFKDQLRLTRRQRVNNDDADGIRREGERTYYVYDASGQRVRKVTELSAGSVKDERIYLGGFEIFRKHGGPIGANTPTLERETLHVMDDKKRIALVETLTPDTAGNDQEFQQLIRYQFGNHLGSASLELDDQSQIISYEEYAPYGSTTYQAVRSQTETAKRYRYTGMERDEESGLYYHGARYCAAWIGRWVSCDPIGIGDGVNLFVYARNSPTLFKDPKGTVAGVDDAAEGLILAFAALVLFTIYWTMPSTQESIRKGVNDLSERLSVPRFSPFYKGNPEDFKPKPKADPKPSTKPEVKPKADPKPDPKPDPKSDPDPLGPDLPPPPPEEKKPNLKRAYIAYVKTNPDTLMHYSGRTSGVVDLNKELQPQLDAIVASRDLAHGSGKSVPGYDREMFMLDEWENQPDESAIAKGGYGPAKLYQYSIGDAVNYSSRYKDKGYLEIRGVEQQMIDFFGRAWSDTKPDKRTGNAVRGVAKDHPFGRRFHDAATVKLGHELHRYTGD
jgi:RHS repeat-associated protein